MVRRNPYGSLLLKGLVWINLPVGGLMFGGWFCFFIFGATLWPHMQWLTLRLAYIVVAVIVPFVSAWLWWSFHIPKWWLWAFAQTDDWDQLEAEAIRAQLIWDERTSWGRLYAKTEIWSSADRQKQVALRSAHDERMRQRAPLSQRS